MKGWRRTRLGECCRVVSGATPSTSNPDYWDGDIPWATPKDLSGLSGPYIADTQRKITRAGLESCAAETLPPGSVLFSSRAPIGHVAINTVPMATNQGFKSLVPDPDEVDAKFLYHWLRRNRVYLENLGRGATFKEISKDLMAEVEIHLPPLDEQRRIAEVLDRAETLIALRRESVVLLTALVEAVFYEMFGDPSTNYHAWWVAELGEFIEFGPQNGLYKPSSQYGFGTPILRIDSFYDGMVTDQAALKRVAVSDAERDVYGLQPGDVVINRVNSLEYLGKCALVPDLNEPTIFESNMMRIRTDPNRLHPRFLVQLLQSKYVKSQILQKAKKAVNQASINQQDVRSLKVMVPPISLQRQFVHRVECIENHKAVHRASLSQLEALYSSLQYRAFRGEL